MCMCAWRTFVCRDCLHLTLHGNFRARVQLEVPVMFAFIYLRDLFKPYLDMALLVTAGMSSVVSYEDNKPISFSEMLPEAKALVIAYAAIGGLLALVDIASVTLYGGGVCATPSAELVVRLEALKATK